VGNVRIALALSYPVDFRGSVVTNYQSNFTLKTSSDNVTLCDLVAAPAEGTTEEAAPVEPEASNEVVPEDAVPEGGDAKPPTAAPPSEEGVQWVKATGGELPEGALKGGEDNGNPLYVARAEHEEAVIPGKLLVEHKVVYIPWGGEEHSKEEYEV